VCSVYGREKKRKEKKREEKRRNEENKEKKLSVSLTGCISFERKTEKFPLLCAAARVQFQPFFLKLMVSLYKPSL
jgi:hypothetical protein